ncbi:unnamed protein product [Brachionus calyciflorus]|uniref:Uncharacterized protein n=1 Tax=Brachionus calyciflorus TaxID=104777 RepID=A0A813MF67_9BILA|nr:unnamed protein product [Brachionus calyciflorus]
MTNKDQSRNYLRQQKQQQQQQKPIEKHINIFITDNKIQHHENNKNQKIPENYTTKIVKKSNESNHQHTTTIFAAAAVATAAALTVISIPDNQEKLNNNTKSKNLPSKHISWAQYASQRRSSLQRRKLEISKKLEQATNAAKNNRKDYSQQLQTKPNTEQKMLTENDTNILNGDNQTADLDEISGALMEYLYSHEISDLGQLNPYDNAESYLLKKESMKRKREEKINFVLNHKWDPKWLKMIRSRCCLPFTILALIMLIYTNLSSSWIKFDGVQRAGLWIVCNRSESIDTDHSPVNTNTNNNIVDLNVNNENLTKNVDKKKFSLIHTLQNAKSKVQNRIDICNTEFYLKEDTHVAIICLSMIGILFHAIGLILLIFGLISSVSDRALYFYHSAGECLITSALVAILCLIAFVLVVSSQIERSFKFGFTLYLHFSITLVTFSVSVLLNLDDLVNEYRLWKIKTQDYKNHLI